MPIIITFEVLTVLSLIAMFIVMFKYGKTSKYKFIPLGFSIIFAILFIKTTYSNFYFYSKFNQSDVYALDIAKSNNNKGYSFLSKFALNEITSCGMYDRITLQYTEDTTDFDKVLIKVGFKKSNFDMTVKPNTGQIIDRGLNYGAVDKNIDGSYKTYVTYGRMLFELDESFNINELDSYVMFYSLDNVKDYSDSFGDYKVYGDCYMRLNN